MTPPNLSSLQRLRKREGRCYELSAKFILDNPSWLLVHGECESGIRYKHAFVRDGERVFDPVRMMMMDRAEYFRKYKVTVDKEYTQRQALAILCRTGHYGAWEEYE